MSLALAVAQQERFEQAMPLSGLLRLDLDVRRPEPMAAAEDSPGEPAAAPAREPGRAGADAPGGRSEKSKPKAEKEGR